MQAFNPCSSIANGTTGSLTDSRDNQIYTVAKINGNWWMTRNLAIGCNGSGNTYGSGRATRSLTSSDSNVSTTWSTGDAGALTSGASYTEPRMQCSSTYGAWYNYTAATAGYITNSKNSTTLADVSVCPKNWRLPTQVEFAGITSYKNAFNVVTGGYYYNGSIEDGSNALWWSATATDSTHRYRLHYNGSTLVANIASTLRLGHYVRCIYST